MSYYAAAITRLEAALRRAKADAEQDRATLANYEESAAKTRENLRQAEIEIAQHAAAIEVLKGAA